MIADNEKGSALLVTLMVIVGLSMLGLGFVAVSETESAISVNERNYTQTLQVAETGARVVAEWFNAPQWAVDNGLMPVNSNTLKQSREISSYTGFYKPDTTVDLLCDTPFSSTEDRFFGANENSADIIISYPAQATFLDQFNQRLFSDLREGGRVIEIRIYAPPVVGGQIHTTSGGLEFWENSVGTRYGLATVAVTAVKTRDGTLTGRVLSRRTVRAVVAEFPLPGTDGPLQSGRGTGTTGNFRVHWGKVVSNANLEVKRINRALPWLNAWDVIPYEEGYAPSYDTSRPQYLYELINKQIEDPWFQVRARGAANPPPGSPATVPGNQLWTYSGPNDNEVADGVSGWSAHWQFQDVDDKAQNKRYASFSRPIYSTWKQLAIAGAGQQGIYYLRYVSGNNGSCLWRSINGQVREWRDWVNYYRQGNEVFFFFETTSGANPQLPNGGTNSTILTPAMSISSAAGNPFEMRGFFYMNMSSWGTQGLSNDNQYYQYPGEPFRDIGVHVADTVTGQLLCDDPLGGATPVTCAANPGADPTLENYTNRRWDFQDLNNNGVFDYVVALNPANITPPGSDTAQINANTRYFIVPYSDACGLAGIGVSPGGCSEPHEPYLNLIYPPSSALASNSNPNPVTVLWENPASQTRRPKQLSAGAPITCSSTSTTTECTSNAYDKSGPYVTLTPGGDGAVLRGIIYNEGDYDAAGNAMYYGALLFQGTVTGAGTPYVFYDEALSRGEWAEQFKNLPRTIMTTIETDQ